MTDRGDRALVTGRADAPAEIHQTAYLRALGLLPAATLAEAAGLLGAIRRRTFT